MNDYVSEFSRFYELREKCSSAFDGKARKLTIKDDLENLLQYLSNSKYRNFHMDRYGDGLVEHFENEMKVLFNFESATFFPTGTMAQQIALKFHTGNDESKVVGLHPLSHPLIFENQAFTELARLQTQTICSIDKMITAEDVMKLKNEIDVLMLEVPMRDLGYLLPTWNEFKRISNAGKMLGIAIHIDGARIWEATHYWGIHLDEIVNFVDSIYVSLYKTIEGHSGAILLGDEKLQNFALNWRHKYGGKIYRQYPAIISAIRGMELNLPLVADYILTSKIIAKIFQTEFSKYAQFKYQIQPFPPQVNHFRILIWIDAPKLNEISIKSMQIFGEAIFDHPWWFDGELTRASVAEFSINSSFDVGRQEKFLSQLRFFIESVNSSLA